MGDDWAYFCVGADAGRDGDFCGFKDARTDMFDERVGGVFGMVFEVLSSSELTSTGCRRWGTFVMLRYASSQLADSKRGS